jgi:hypothetical protein
MNETNTNADPSTRRMEAEHRRWLIGIAISVAFGTFGAVMAWLSYSARTRPTAPSAVQIARPASGESEPTSRHRRKDSEHR